MKDLNKIFEESNRRRKMFTWFILGQGIHCLPWSCYKFLTPEWVTKHYNIEL